MEKSSINYKYVFNKVFTGSYLDYNLGHELINFIETDQHKRYVYLNPWGKCSKEALKKTEYVLHIMGVNYLNEKETKQEKYFELIAVSEIDTEHSKKILDSIKNKNEDLRDEIDAKEYTFEKIPIKDGKNGIFIDEKAKKYTFKAKRLLKPKKNYRILFKINSSKSSKGLNSKKSGNVDVIRINVQSNPQHQIAYSRNDDINALNQLICDEQFEFLDVEKENIKINDYDDEQCFAVISGRTNLENSFSNQIAYFLSRDKNILTEFIGLLNNKIKENKRNEEEINEEDFEIYREYEHIDLLLKSNEDVIVIENKIDSDINGIDGKKSQLSKYYNYVINDEKRNFKNKDDKKISNEKKHFFILEPKYSSITEERLKKLKNGNCYNIIYYDELYKSLYKLYDKKDKSNPHGTTSTKENMKENDFLYLYKQFIDGLYYVKSSKEEQQEKTAYIRLKQRINELKEKKQH